MSEYKKISDLICIRKDPAGYNYNDNPSIEVTLKNGKYSTSDELVLKDLLSQALLKFSNITNHPFIQEEKL